MTDVTETVENENATVEENTPAPEAGQSVEITAADLATMVRIIDAGSQRGTFRGEELMAVGTLRNKLAAAVNLLSGEKTDGESDGGGEEIATNEETATGEEAA